MEKCIDPAVVCLRSYSYGIKRRFHFSGSALTLLNGEEGLSIPVGFYETRRNIAGCRKDLLALFVWSGQVWLQVGNIVANASAPNFHVKVVAGKLFRHRIELRDGKILIEKVFFWSFSTPDCSRLDGPFLVEIAHWLSDPRKKAAFIELWTKDRCADNA